MPFGPNLFSGQMTTQSSPELLPPPALEQREQLEGSNIADSIAEDLGALAGNTEPTKGIQLNDSMLSTQSTFITRSGEQVMPNRNPEGFLRQGGLIIDGNSLYLDSIEQSQVPVANLRGALIKMVQQGIPQISVKSFTKDRVFDARELIKKKFRLG